MIKGIHSAVIWTQDLAKLASFYRDTMGLQSEMDTGEFVAFKSETGAQLALGKHSEVTGRSREPYRVMLDLTVDDCQAEYERLKGKGVKFLREPSRDEGGGFVIATLQDPDGNTLQLFQAV